MKRFIIISFLFVVKLSAISQCNPNENKVIVMGDSWSFFSWTYNSFNENFDKYGFTDVRAFSDTSISVMGAHADSYFYPSYRKTNIVTALNNNPSAEIIHMSLGGNDFLTMWDNSMTLTQSDSIIQDIIQYVKNDIDTIRSINPDLTVYLAGYDFPNFVETAGVVGSTHPFHGLWSNMGQPTALELNSFVTRYHQFFIDSINTWDNVYMVNNVGLMQWTHGQTNPLLIFPFSTYPPQSVPLPGGNINFPSPLEAMGAGGADSFHLGDSSYETFVERMVRLFYWKQLRKADMSIYADNINSGTVFSDASTSATEVKVGNSAGLQANGVLSFDTSPLDESFSIAKASIFLKRKNLAGVNPNAEYLVVGVKSGSYGASVTLDGDEFSALSDQVDTLCTYGTIATNGNWMRFDLSQEQFTAINPLGTTQFKLAYLFADAGRNIDFYNDIDTNNQVVLDITYGEPVSVKENGKAKGLKMYPNPASHELLISFDSDQAGVVQVYNMLGNLVKEVNISAKQVNINIADLSSGTYLVKFYSGEQLLTEKLIVE